MTIPNNEGNTSLEQIFPCLCHAAEQDKTYFPQDKDILIKQLTTSQELPTNQLATIEKAIDISIACLWPLVSELFITDQFKGRFDAAWQMLCAAKFAAEENPLADNLAKELAKQIWQWEEELCIILSPQIPYAAEDK